MSTIRWSRGVLSLLIVLVAAGCAGTGNQPETGGETGRLRVMATTTLVGDVAAQVAGELIDLTVLMPVGVDPHSFQPVPRDAAATANANLILINGLSFETFLADLLSNAGADVPIVSVSAGIEPRALAEVPDDHPADDGQELDDQHEGSDPHVWFDVANVIVWTENIRAALSAADPTNAPAYARNAAAYSTQLEELDGWIEDQVAQIPDARRQLVTDHAVLGYFADRYGFDLVGAVVPAFSTAAAPSAREMAALQAAIASLDVPAIFVGTTVNPNTAEQVAADTGITVVRLYTGSLSEPGGPAESYIAFMRYNVTAIVEALAR